MSEISCKYCGRDGMDKHQNLVHVCDRATVEQRYDEADARIASLEAQLAAATALRPDETDTLTPDELRQEVRNLYATIEALHGEINGRNDELFAQGRQLAAAQERERVYQEVYGDLPDDIESTYRRQEREIAALRAKLAALAAQQPARDGGEYRCPHCGSDNPGTEPECPECGR